MSHTDNAVWLLLFWENGMKIEVHTSTKTYPVIVERGLLKRASEIIGRQGHVYIITDDGVPEKWRNMLHAQYPGAHMFVCAHGEKHKNLITWQMILEDMLNANLSRKDTVIALGGGVVGDMAGFAAACYMRGIAYINIPTTTLSQIDSSIGGKTAVDLDGAKNCVGAFWQPDMVLVDTEVLETLPRRHYYNGLVEAVKEGLTFDEELFALFEEGNVDEHLEEIITRCLLIKKDIVEKDEREGGLRKLLNFGHTYGHAYETYFGMEGYYHGECVGLGMLTIIENEALRERVKNVLEQMHCPTTCDVDADKVMELLHHDKKADHDHVTVVRVEEAGKGYLEEWTFDQLEKRLKHE